MKKPAGGGLVAVQDCRDGQSVGSVGSRALERLEEHVAHGTDVGLDAVEPVGIGLAVFGTLTLDAISFEGKLAVETVEERLVGEVSVMIKRGFHSIFGHRAGASLRR